MLYNLFVDSLDDAIEYLVECNFMSNIKGSDILYSLNFIRMIDIYTINMLEEVKQIGLKYPDVNVPLEEIEVVYDIYVDLQVKYGGL